MEKIMQNRAILVAAIVSALTFTAYAQSTVLPKAELNAGYLPHRAVYDLVLAPGANPDKSPVQTARARMLYEFTGSVCEGWSTTTRLLTELTPQEGTPQVSDISSKTFENIQTREFRFLTRSVVDGEVREEADGVAHQDKESQLKIALKKPSKRDVAPTGPVLFPTQHLTAILMAAHNGEKVIEADLFDGSEHGDKIYATTTIIGRPRLTAPPAGYPTEKAKLNQLPRWPMTVSFFDRQAKNDGEQIPLYELNLEVYDNGITYSMTLGYSSFNMKGTLTSLELLPVSACK